MRFRVLDALRGMCASMVVLMHMPTTGAISASPIIKHGYLFVDFFFVLSGFVIAASYGDKLRAGFSLPRFMALRLGRVYPLHAAMLAAYLAAYLAISLTPALAHSHTEGAYSVASFVASLTMTHIFIGPDTTFWNGPSWSIAAEVWTYLVFGLLFRVGRFVVPVSLAVAALSVTMLAVLSPGTYHFLNDFHDGALIRCMFGFALGVVVFHWRRMMGDTERHPIWTAAEIIVVAVIVLAIVKWGGTKLELAIPVMFAAAMFVFSYEGGLVSVLLGKRPFLLLGTLSYSIYMIHFFLAEKIVGVLDVIGRMNPELAVVHIVNGKQVLGFTVLGGDLISVAFLALVVGCSWLTYRWIEKPAREWSRRAVLDTVEIKHRSARTPSTSRGFLLSRKPSQPSRPPSAQN